MNEPKTNTNPNPSLQKKTAARTAAVQCLYQLSVTGDALDPARQVKALQGSLKDNREEQKLRVGMAVEPNYPLLMRILEGIQERLDEINALLDKSLSAEWSRARMSPVLVALLQCAIFEMCFDKGVSPGIVTDEYTRLARSFFGEQEVGFVHSLLRTLAAKQHG